jgi:glycosyltransferase involved in cell wall biosynthesis
LSRVLFLAESFHPVLGGGEQHLLRLSRRLAALGDGATVVTRRSETAWPAEETLDGVRVVRVPPPGPARSGKYRMLPAAFRAALRELRRHDLLVVRGTRVLGLPGLVAARLAGRPVVLQPEINGELSGEAYVWGTSLQGRTGERMVRAATRLRNRLLLDADACVAMSRRIACECGAAGLPAEKIALIPHGVDRARFRPADAPERSALRARLGLPGGGLLVVYAGRLLRGKGLEDLVEALARSATPSGHLLLVGSGAGQALSVEEALKAQVAALGLGPRVTFAGHVENVEDWLRASDVFVLPSRFEALGLALVEAAACGLACIGAETGGIVDVIADGRSGLLVPPGDVAALAAALERLARDASLREGLGQGAVLVVRERFDEDDALVRYRALFAELVARDALGARARPAAAGARP